MKSQGKDIEIDKRIKNGIKYELMKSLNKMTVYIYIHKWTKWTKQCV